MNNFLRDVLKGLQSPVKYLDSKYFYDKKGDEIFQQIMASKEYYLTNSEMEIFSKQTSGIADSVLKKNKKLDVIEFGPGDAIKSTFLLKELAKKNGIATYFPIDISNNIIELLNNKIPRNLPQLHVHGLNGEYLDMLSEANRISKNRKLVLFLGANIGNFKFEEIPFFCNKLRSLLSKDDMVFIGFDLKKNPKKILAAYDDEEGLTRQFNLNLLRRINRDLKADFNVRKFEHYATYDPDDGACKSYLFSLAEQDVLIDGKHRIHFEKDEQVFMEISRKYSVEQIDEMAVQCGFKPVADFFDKKKYFVDVLWKC